MARKYLSEEHRRLASAVRAAVRLCADPTDERAVLTVLRDGRPTNSPVLPRTYVVTPTGARVVQSDLVRGKYSRGTVQPPLRGLVLYSSANPQPEFFLGEIVWIDADLGGRHLGFLGHRGAKEGTGVIVVKHESLGAPPRSIPLEVMTAVYVTAISSLIERARALDVEPGKADLLVTYQVMTS